MKYFVVNGTFKEGRPEGPAFKAALDAHHAHIDQYLRSGDILTCGPKPGGGGVMIIRAESREALDRILANDPFVTGGIQEYAVSEFTVYSIQEYAKQWKI